MTTLNPVPSKKKTWVVLVGGALGIIIPFITELTAGLDQPWPALISLAIWGATAAGVYQAPYAKPDQILVERSVVESPSVSNIELTKEDPRHPLEGDGYENPWKK